MKTKSIEDFERELREEENKFNKIIPSDPGDAYRLSQIKIVTENVHDDLLLAYKSSQSSEAYKERLLAVMTRCSSLIENIDKAIS